MIKLRTALLVAAATLATLPAIAPAQVPPDQNRDRHGPDGRGDRGDRGDRGYRGNQAPPPGAQPGQPAPAGRPDPGNAQDRRGPDGREDRGFQGDRRADDRRFQGDRRGFAPGDRRPDDRSQPGDRRGFDGRGGPDWRSGDGNRGRDNGYYRQPGADRGRIAGWDGGRGSWREDRRYDWHGWRDQNRALFRGPRYIAPRGFGYRPYSVGFRLQPFFYSRTYWIDDPYAFRLPPADGPYRWVRYYNDVLLVDLRNGAIVDVIRQFFL